jgi:hypothetical protein
MPPRQIDTARRRGTVCRGVCACVGVAQKNKSHKMIILHAARAPAKSGFVFWSLAPAADLLIMRAQKLQSLAQNLSVVTVPAGVDHFI